jgi:YegS/Rv2252/BmrU family lipid kinase
LSTAITAIVNPAAGHGKALETWAKVRAHLKCAVETVRTEGPGHATRIAAQALAQGADTIVAVGGDGTINEVVNGFFEQDKLISNRASLAIVPHGTGSDFIKMLQLPPDSETAAGVIQDKNHRLLDLMKVRYTKLDGTPASRYAINITSFGMGAAVASRVNRSRKVFGRKMSFVLATVRTAMTFSGNSVSICFDNSKTLDAEVTNVAVGNGKYQGAGMLACPCAAIDDGFLDVTLVEFLPALQLIRNLPLLYNGKIYSHPKIQFHRVQSMRVDSKKIVLVEVDGETVGRLPIEISVMPQAIRMSVGKMSSPE